MKQVVVRVGAAVALGLFLSVTASDAADLKIGVVDLQRALNESKEGRRAKEQFKVEFERLQESLKSEKDELDRMKQDLEKKSLVLKEDQRQSLAEEFERKRRDLRRKLEDSDADLRKKDSELTGKILTSHGNRPKGAQPHGRQCHPQQRTRAPRAIQQQIR